MDENEKPTMTEQELWEWLHNDEGIPVSRRTIKQAVQDREIVPTRYGNGNYFSKNDGWNFIASRKRPTATRFVGSNAGRRPAAVSES